MSWRDPQDELDEADRYIRVRLHLGADPERVMIGLLWAAARLSAYLGRAEIHDQAIADLKAQEAAELAAHKGRMGPGSETPQ